MKPRSRLFLRLVLWGGVMPALAWAILAGGRRAAAPYVDGARGGLPASTRRAQQTVWKRIAPLDEVGFTRLDPDDPGGWLSVFYEKPQTLADLQRSHPIRPTVGRRTLVLQPLGPLEPRERAVLAAMREYAEAFFQLPARVAEPLPLPPEDAAGSRVRGGHRQFEAGRILDRVLAPRLPKDAVVYLGVTMADLWTEDLNFVFGLGSYGRRVGVYSLCRYYPEFRSRVREPGDDQAGLVRACKVLNHEVGHVFGLSHCVFYRCSMNGTNSLRETDAAPLHYCPVCHRKLLWNVGFDPDRRLRDLETFYRRNGCAEEAEWTAARRARWRELEGRRG